MKVKEGFKTAVLILLTISMFALFFATWAYSLEPGNTGFSLFSFQKQAGNGVEDETPVISKAASPIKGGANAGSGLYGACGGFGDLVSLYERIRPVLAEAIGSANKFAVTDENQFEAALSGKMVYFQYSGRVPLFLIGQWLGVSPRSNLDIPVGSIVLSASENDIVLYWRDALSGKVYSAKTAAMSESLISAAASFVSNGCRFAAEDKTAYSMLLPETLIFPSVPVMQKYSVSNALENADQKYIQTILSAFDYNVYTIRKYPELDGTQVYVGEKSTLQIYPDGNMRFLAQDPSYGLDIPGLPTNDEQKKIAYMVEKTRALAEKTTQNASGSAALSFSGYSYDEKSDTYTVSFDYLLENTPVLMGENDHAFRASISENRIFDISCHLRRFQKTEETCYLMPQKQAAAAIVLSRVMAKTSMLVCYRDDGNGSFFAKWNYEGF